MPFQLVSPFQPTGDQPQAIEALTAKIQAGNRHQTLLGVTGSGKTFTMANIIAKTQKPTLIIAHNKTLAAQLYQEFRDFFPNNAVSYFVSYYDYYQPEAYIPTTDTYIEKEAQINDEIDKLRLASTTNLMTRDDVIIIASVSCIYNLGSPVEYGQYMMELIEGEIIARESLLIQLSNMQYERSSAELRRGTYRLRGDTIQIWPAYQDTALNLDTLANQIVSIDEIDPISGQITPNSRAFQAQTGHLKRYVLYPAKHYLINPKNQADSIKEIEQDLIDRVAQLTQAGKTLEAYRLKQKVSYDLEMIKEFGFVNGIENYSRYFDGREPGSAPFTLLEYFRENRRRFGKTADGQADTFLTIIDESHISVPQIRGMYNGDQARKKTLIDYGFRLPSALDNRPLQFQEFLANNDQFLYVSATPNDWEVQQSGGSEQVVEQLVRPTGLLDPPLEVRSSKNQIEDLVWEVVLRKQRGQRAIVTTLTKKMAEVLTDYLNDEQKIKKLIAHHLKNNPELSADNLALPKVAYLHSDVETLERSDILTSLRKGEYDVVVGINLLREGLDLPEVTLVAILDADKEGFLRSATSLIQTIGRAARHDQGMAILYAEKITKSMQIAIDETTRRRQIQLEYNQKHGITPATIIKPIRDRMVEKKEDNDYETIGQNSSAKSANKKPKKPLLVYLSKKEAVDLNNFDPTSFTPGEKNRLAKLLKTKMHQAADDLDFELAAIIRDSLEKI